jgi:hypothetical protein
MKILTIAWPRTVALQGKIGEAGSVRESARADGCELSIFRPLEAGDAISG